MIVQTSIPPNATVSPNSQTPSPESGIGLIELSERMRSACGHLVALSSEVNAIGDSGLRRQMWGELVDLARKLSGMAQHRRKLNNIINAEGVRA